MSNVAGVNSTSSDPTSQMSIGFTALIICGIAIIPLIACTVLAVKRNWRRSAPPPDAEQATTSDQPAEKKANSFLSRQPFVITLPKFPEIVKQKSASRKSQSQAGGMLMAFPSAM